MKDPEEKVNQLVAECYEKYRHPVFLYVYYKTGKKEESEDLTQDAFARLLEYRKMLCEETVKHFFVYNCPQPGDGLPAPPLQAAGSGSISV